MQNGRDRNGGTWLKGEILRGAYAMPHGSTTGAYPGARHGLYLYTSSSEPSTAAMFRVQACLGSVELISGDGAPLELKLSLQ